jgi:hypothetical protein
MFWPFKLSFVVDILAFFDLETFLAIFLKKLAFFINNLLVTLKSFLTNKHTSRFARNVNNKEKSFQTFTYGK